MRNRSLIMEAADPTTATTQPEYTGTNAQPEGEQRIDRRGILRAALGVAAATVGTAAGLETRSGTALAATGDIVTVGSSFSGANTTTITVNGGSGGAIAGSGQNGQIGLVGISDSGQGVYGVSVSGVGGYFQGGLAPVRLSLASTSGAPLFSSTAHNPGEVYADSNGALYSCTAAGVPGRWASLSNPFCDARTYGAVGDGQSLTDGTMSAASNVLTSASARFSASDIGKLVTVAGAGASGNTLSTTIASYQSAMQVTLTASALGSVSGAIVSWGTDDSAAIQNAINAAASTPWGSGGTVIVSPGIYMIGTALQLASNVALRGMSRAATTLRLGGSAVRIIQNGNSAVQAANLSNVEIADVAFDANSLGGCILIGYGCANFSLSGCLIQNTLDINGVTRIGGLTEAVLIGGVSVNLSGSVQTKNVQVIGNLFWNNRVYNEGLMLMHCADATVTGNLFCGTQGGGVAALSTWGYGHNISISGNTFRDNAFVDFYIQEGDTVTVSACTFHRSASGSGSASHVMVMNANNVAVQGCTFYDASESITSVVFQDTGYGGFGGNPHQYPYSSSVAITGCDFMKGHQAIRVASGAASISSTTTNLMTDILIADCNFEPPTGTPGADVIAVGSTVAQNVNRVTIRGCRINASIAPGATTPGGQYSGAGILVQGNNASVNTALAQAVTGSTSAQSVAVASTAGMTRYNWLHIGGTTPEDVEIMDIVGEQVTGYFLFNHRQGDPITSSGGSIVNNGVTDCWLDSNTIVASTTGTSWGIKLAGGVSQVRLTSNDIRLAGSGQGGPFMLQDGSTYQLARGNIGAINPNFKVATPPFPVSGISGWLRNTTGVDVTATITPTGVTQQHMYINTTAVIAGAIDYGATIPNTVTLPAGAWFRADYITGSYSWKWQGS